MACAKAVVASRLTGMAQLIQDQQSGWLINPGDAPELANAITTLLHDGAQRAQLGANARRRVECEFSWRTIARRYLDFAQAQGWGHD